jgi:CheY-like chemotaxis protein
MRLLEVPLAETCLLQSNLAGWHSWLAGQGVSHPNRIAIPCVLKNAAAWHGSGLTRWWLLMEKILLADDDASIQQMLGQVLISEQYDVIFAATGCAAAEKFMNDLPDLVLLDLNMPDRDGWNTFDLMYGIHPWVPVIIITAKSRQHERAAELGVDALMEKPLDIPLLLETIQDFLAESETKRAQRLARLDFKTIHLNGHVPKSYSTANLCSWPMKAFNTNFA